MVAEEVPGAPQHGSVASAKTARSSPALWRGRRGSSKTTSSSKIHNCVKTAKSSAAASRTAKDWRSGGRLHGPAVRPLAAANNKTIHCARTSSTCATPSALEAQGLLRQAAALIGQVTRMLAPQNLSSISSRRCGSQSVGGIKIGSGRERPPRTAKSGGEVCAESKQTSKKRGGALSRSNRQHMRAEARAKVAAIELVQSCMRAEARAETAEFELVHAEARMKAAAIELVEVRSLGCQVRADHNEMVCMLEDQVNGYAFALQQLQLNAGSYIENLELNLEACLRLQLNAESASENDKAYIENLELNLEVSRPFTTRHTLRIWS